MLFPLLEFLFPKLRLKHAEHGSYGGGVYFVEIVEADGRVAIAMLSVDRLA